VLKQRVWFNKRKAGRKSRMTDQRIEALSALDFEWTPKDASWSSSFNDLIEFRDKNGHMEVPRGKLYKWMGVQREFRKAQKAGKTQTWGKNVTCLTTERIKKLESISFPW
jgi:Helicase associated domain